MIIRSIRQILVGRRLHAIAPDQSVRMASKSLADHDIGALAVIEGTALVGLLSERDIIRRAVCKGLDMDATRVGDVMTAAPVTVMADASLADAMAVMVKGGFRHLPVIDAGTVLGMLAKRDIPTDYRLMFERFDAYRHPPVASVPAE